LGRKKGLSKRSCTKEEAASPTPGLKVKDEKVEKGEGFNRRTPKSLSNLETI